MPLAKPVCVAHWRAEIRPFNCTFCNLPSHCLISSNEKPGCWYGILQKGKINISSTKTTDALFSKDWSVVSCNTAIIRGKELWLLQPQMKHETLRDISGILNTLTETIITYTNANQPTCPEDSALSDYVTPLSSPPASDVSPLMYLAQHNHLTSGLNTYTLTIPSLWWIKSETWNTFLPSLNIS